MHTRPRREPILPLRQKKRAETRLAFFRAATALFRERGVRATSVNDIAGRAGFSRAAFFKHFDGKLSVLRVYGEQLEPRLEHALRGAEDQAPLARVRGLLLAMAKEAEANRGDLAVVLAVSLGDPSYLAGPTPTRRRVLLQMTRLLEEAQRRGEAGRGLTPGQQAEQLLALYQQAISSVILRGSRAEAAIDIAWRFALTGLGGPRRKDRGTRHS